MSNIRAEKLDDILGRIICGGMGVGLSNYRDFVYGLWDLGILPTLSSAAWRHVVSFELDRKVSTAEAMHHTIKTLKQGKKGLKLAVNVMMRTADSDEAILGACEDPEYHTDALVLGAGLPPKKLPEQVPRDDIPLIVIVSSDHAAQVVCRSWKRCDRLPDAFIVEGPKAGGHTGFKDLLEMKSEKSTLFNLFKEVKAFADPLGIPVIAAGGIWTKDVIDWFLAEGARSVQMSTKFQAAEEMGISEEFRRALVACRREDITVVLPGANEPCSPCGMPFRVLKQSPYFEDPIPGKFPCRYGFVAQKDPDGNLCCLAHSDPSQRFCICSGLLTTYDRRISAAYGGKELWTVGANAYRIKEIEPLKKIASRLN